MIRYFVLFLVEYVVVSFAVLVVSKDGRRVPIRESSLFLVSWPLILSRMALESLFN